MLKDQQIMRQCGNIEALKKRIKEVKDSKGFMGMLKGGQDGKIKELEAQKLQLELH